MSTRNDWNNEYLFTEEERDDFTIPDRSPNINENYAGDYWEELELFRTKRGIVQKITYYFNKMLSHIYPEGYDDFGELITESKPYRIHRTFEKRENYTRRHSNLIEAFPESLLAELDAYFSDETIKWRAASDFVYAAYFLYHGIKNIEEIEGQPTLTDYKYTRTLKLFERYGLMDYESDLLSFLTNGIEINVDSDNLENLKKQEIIFRRLCDASINRKWVSVLQYKAPYYHIEIETKDQLILIGRDASYPMNSHYVLLNDITFEAEDFESGGICYNNGEGWLPIGNSDSDSFDGFFDGDGYVISGIVCNPTEVTWYAGLFGRINERGVVRNLGVEDITISAPLARFMGGICSFNHGTIDSCYTTGTISGDADPALIGGISGYTLGGTITESYSLMEISAPNHNACVGGISGALGRGLIQNCYAYSDNLYSRSRVGGIVGIDYDESSTVEKSYCRCVIGSELEIYEGGVIGEVRFEGTTCEYCHYDSDINEQDLNNGFGFPRTTTELKSQSNFINWDFDTIWDMTDADFPYLRWQASHDHNNE